jgi:hypothetical protein
MHTEAERKTDLKAKIRRGFASVATQSGHTIRAHEANSGPRCSEMPVSEVDRMSAMRHCSCCGGIMQLSH